MMGPKDPRHGKYAGYQAHMKEGPRPACGPCKAARRARDRAVAYERNAGRSRTVDATTAREHIADCVGRGMRLEVFVRAGVPSAPTIYSGHSKRIHATTEERVLDVVPQPGVNCWPAFSAVRRLRALVALGHSQEELVVRLGSYRSYVSMLINDTRGWRHLDPDMWLRVADVYEALSMTLGTSNRSRNRALDRGWVPPLAWDDIDDPDETPVVRRGPAGRHRTDVDEAVVLRILNGERMSCTKAEKAEVTRRWIRSGRHLSDLADFTGWKPERYGHVHQEAS